MAEMLPSAYPRLRGIPKGMQRDFIPPNCQNWTQQLMKNMLLI